MARPSPADNFPPGATFVSTPTLDQRLERIVLLLEEARAPAAELLSPTEAARFLGVSTSKFHQLEGGGWIGPMAVSLGDGHCPRYPKSELLAWIRAGAVPRNQWRFCRDGAMKRRTGT